MLHSANPNIDALVMGASAGGVKLLSTLLPQLPEQLPFPVFIVVHQKAGGTHYLGSILNDHCRLPVHEAEDKMTIEPGHVYLAPADYHLLIETPDAIALSCDEPVHCCRPSVDMLFESAADVFQARLLGIILTGMGCDGAAGLKAIHQAGGLCAVQDPTIAAFPSMPEAAIASVPDAQIINPDIFEHDLLTTISTYHKR